MLRISSINNQKVKDWLLLLKAKYRKQKRLFLVEGYKECSRAMSSNYSIKELIICEDFLSTEAQKKLKINLPDNTPIFSVSEKVYNKVAYRKDSQGVIALFHMKEDTLQGIDLSVKGPKLIIVLDSVEKPGNLGAVLRTADAVGAKAILISGNAIDPYNPNVIRASLGTRFSVPVVLEQTHKIVEWLHANQFRIHGAALPAYNDLYSSELTKNTAFVFGAEDKGLGEDWLTTSDENFTIPMHGIADSLNLSVSVAVASYEFLRKFPKT